MSPPITSNDPPVLTIKTTLPSKLISRLGGRGGGGEGEGVMERIKEMKLCPCVEGGGAGAGRGPGEGGVSESLYQKMYKDRLALLTLWFSS